MTRLRTLAAALLIAGASAFPSHAGEPEDSIRDVIQSQLDAFEAESAEDAYAFAAPNIQRMFPTPEVFGRMVERGYPMVWNPADAEFLDSKPRGDGIVQRLRFIDQRGRAHIGEYMMVLIDGEWRIAGVSIIRDDSYGA